MSPLVQPARAVAARVLAAPRLRPTFLIIGAQKSGTTALHAYLTEHPAVLTAQKKELHYFNNAYGPDNPHGRADRWYLSQFPLKAQAALVQRRLGVRPVVGEATPAYLFHPRVPVRVHAFDPSMKLIAVLRDPIERAYSQYQRGIRSGYHTLSFEEALELEREYLPAELERIAHDPLYVSPTGLQHSYVARGRYIEQLERWLELFPREQLLVLTREELLTQTAGELSQVYRFLRIPEPPARSYPVVGVNSYEDMSAATRERLADEFEPHTSRLEQLLGRKLPWTRPAG